MSIRSITLAFAVLALSAGAAMAHPKLLTATPSGEVKGAPKGVHLTFNEALSAKFSGVEIVSASGAVVKTGTAQLDPKDKKQLLVSILGPVTPGVYTVKWHAVAEDTHRVEGVYSFTVK